MQLYAPRAANNLVNTEAVIVLASLLEVNNVP
jgi:hypothetical protein